MRRAFAIIPCAAVLLFSGCEPSSPEDKARAQAEENIKKEEKKLFDNTTGSQERKYQVKNSEDYKMLRKAAVENETERIKKETEKNKK